MNTFDIVVVGAGPSGLAAATRAVTRGLKVCVLEKQERIGGSVQTTTESGFLAEAGPNTLVLSDDSLRPLLDASGLTDRLIAANPAAKDRFIVRGGRPRRLPRSPVGLLTTPIFSLRGKFRVFGDLIKATTTDVDTISLGGFVRDRFGTEAVDYALNPLIGGIYAGDPDQLILRHAFPALHEIASTSRSLILGGIRSARRKRALAKGSEDPSAPRTRRRMVSFPGGLAELTNALATEITRAPGSQIQLNAMIRRIGAAPAGNWQTTLDDGTVIASRGLVLAVPGHALAKLPFDLPAFGPVARDAAAIRYPAVTSVSLGYQRDAIAHPLGGFGALVPAKERLSILGVLFASELFPGRAPDGQVLLTCFTGGTRQPEIAALEDDALLRTIHQDLSGLLGIRDSAASTWTAITRWSHAIPQYDHAYGTAIHAISQFESQFPSVRVVGQIRDGISLPNSLVSGWRGIPEVSLS